MTYAIETLLIMIAILYGILLSPAWLWCFPAALAIASIKHYLKGTKKK